VSNPWVGDLSAAEAAERGGAYAERFDRLAARGNDVHGEAELVATLLGMTTVTKNSADGPSVLDAGCGTGRVAARLAEIGCQTIGVDVDAGMLGQARLRHPNLSWVESDLAELTASALGLRSEPRTGMDAIVAAGNVMPLLTPGTETRVIEVLAGLLRPGGLLIAGFGLDDAHLPPSAPASARFRSLAHYDQDCSAAGLRLRDRWATWDRAEFGSIQAEAGYAVSVHIRD
jgi:SAM-dependent methyltransferase